MRAATISVVISSRASSEGRASKRRGYPDLVGISDKLRRSFSDEFDDEFPIGDQEGDTAFVGTNVLRGLIEGIDDFINVRQSRWRRYRSLGPILLGSAMWINDEELVAKLDKLSGACVVVTKQGRKGDLKKLEPLATINDRTPGIPSRAFSALTGLSPRSSGTPLVVGPYTLTDDRTVPTIRQSAFASCLKTVCRPLCTPSLPWWATFGGTTRMRRGTSST